MCRPIRNTDPEVYRLITIRTLEARLWITPSSNVRKIIGGILGRYQELLSILIYAYEVLGNHMHLLIKAPKSNTDEFCENVNREIARRLNWKHRREGKFWARRYDDQEVLTEEDLLEAFLYVTTNATRHGLVRDSRSWPGLNSFDHSLNEQDREFTFYHYSERDDEGRTKTTRHKLKLSVLPQFEKLTKKERRGVIEGLLNKRMDRIAEERKENGEGFLGVSRILEIEPGAKPQNISRSPRPPCYTGCRELRKEFCRALRERMRDYRLASLRFRLGELTTIFPEFCFKPPLHRIPRILPFTPLSQDFLKNAA